MEITSAVDLIVFAGQSNMAGRGDAEDAPECLPGAGYEYKAVSAPEDLFRFRSHLVSMKTGQMDFQTGQKMEVRNVPEVW